MVRRFVVCFAMLSALGGGLQAQERRPFDYPDLFRPSSIGQIALSPDGSSLLYTITHGSFPAPSRNSHIHLATVDGAVDRPLTQERDGDHRDPKWHPSGQLVGFTSSRGSGGRQLYLMPLDGGEASQLTRVEGGIAAWGWSHDGRWLAYLGGRDGERQLWIQDGRGAGQPRRLTSHPTPINSFEWRENAEEILFLAPDRWDAADAARRRAGYRARTIQRGIAHPDFLELSPSHLWRVGVNGGSSARLTDGELRITGLVQSPDGGHIALTVGSMDPYRDDRANEIYLLDTTTRAIERLTNNDVGERVVSFSPDGRTLAIMAPADFSASVNDIFVRPVAGGSWRAVTAGFDNEISDAMWADDGRALLFAGASGVNTQLFRVELSGGGIHALTSLEGVVSLAGADPGGVAIVRYTDPRTPADLYASSWASIGDRSRWTRLTRANPWVDSLRLAEYETVRWTSPDGMEIEGLLIYPLDYDPGRSYPLITDIHGGPASAYENMFDPTQGRPQRGYMHLMAAHGYAVFRPNYRGSSNYGNRFKSEISGDYWSRATEDIHAGIDQLIARGIAHPDSLGFMGWSAGGHWSNWMLVTTDRFKAISSGAGVSNWISLYGQTDNQSSREFYIGRSSSLDAANKPWDDFEHWWNESPLKYIENASTPTLLHYGSLDERVPMPQGQELHMALKQLGVPTEFIVYPDEPHGLREPTNQLVKMMAEMGWFERWIRGADSWLDWAEVLEVGKAIEKALGADTGEGR